MMKEKFRVPGNTPRWIRDTLVPTKEHWLAIVNRAGGVASFAVHYRGNKGGYASLVRLNQGCHLSMNGTGNSSAVAVTTSIWNSNNDKRIEKYLDYIFDPLHSPWRRCFSKVHRHKVDGVTKAVTIELNVNPYSGILQSLMIMTRNVYEKQDRVLFWCDLVDAGATHAEAMFLNASFQPYTNGGYIKNRPVHHFTFDTGVSYRKLANGTPDHSLNIYTRGDGWSKVNAQWSGDQQDREKVFDRVLKSSRKIVAKKYEGPFKWFRPYQQTPAAGRLNVKPVEFVKALRECLEHGEILRG